jgi:diketogulonate reductase-like aldo/keto reductase
MPGAYSNPDSAIEESLKKLDVDYIDLMLIHQPGSNDEKFINLWKNIIIMEN